MSIEERECELSSDCTTIVDDIRVLKFCFPIIPGSNRSFFCECSGYFGFTGELCDQPSIQSRSLTALAFLVLVVNGIMMFLTISNLNRYRQLKHSSFARKASKSEKRVSVYIPFLLFLALLTGINNMIRGSGLLAVLFDPRKVKLRRIDYLFSQENIELVSNPLKNVSFVVGFLGSFLPSLFATYLMLYWLSILDISSISLSASSYKTLQYSQKLVKTVTVVAGILMMFAVAFRLLDLAALVSFVMGIMGTCLAFYSRRTFLKALRVLNKEGDPLSDIARMISTTSYGFIILWVSSSILGLLFGILGRTVALTVSPGEFNYFFNLLELSQTFPLLVMIYSLDFIRSVLKRLVRRRLHSTYQSSKNTESAFELESSCVLEKL